MRERERGRKRERQKDRIRERGLRGTRYREDDRGGRLDKIKREKEEVRVMREKESERNRLQVDTE